MNPPLPANEQSVALLNARHSRARPIIAAALRRIVPLTWEGHETIPKDGPAVFLANHVQFPDAITMNVVADRAVVVMGTESLAQGLAGRLVLAYGLSPKKKNMPDSKAVRLLKAWVDAGAAIGIFPEGERTWTGKPLPLLPGIEKLVLLLGVPVITMRIHNGYRQWPRWAPLPRRGRVHVEVDPPVQFTKAMGSQAVAAELTKRLRVDDADSRHWPLRGFRLAKGISNVVFACPHCGGLETLDEQASAVLCNACRERWEVTPDATLVGKGGERSLTEISEGLVARLAQRGWRDPGLSGDAILRSEPCTLMDESGEEAVTLGRGQLVLTPEEIRLEGELSWRLPLSELATANVENRRRFWLRTKDGRLFEPVFPRESVLKWERFVEHWRTGTPPT